MVALLIAFALVFGTPVYAQQISCEDARDMAVNYAQNLEKSRTDVEVQLAQLKVAFKKLQDEFDDFKKKHANAANKKDQGKKE